MKIFHEVPLCLLEESRTFNDGDYALVHLLDQYPKYLDFFVKSLEMGRTVLLDNSLFELGQQFDIDVFARWIDVLRPTEYIIPDKFDDMTTTLVAAEIWNKQYAALPGKKIGVVQGATKAQIIQCYTELEPMVDKIAINFHSVPYLSMVSHPNKWIRLMMGRIEFLSTLLSMGILNKKKPHHLLGSTHPIEFSFYGDGFDWIESLDTSSPIMLGIEGGIYGEKIGHWQKIKTKMVDVLDIELSAIQKIHIERNILQFRKMVEGI